MTKLTFYSGLKEIGGTVVGVETETAICLFDFGFSYADRLDNKVSFHKGLEAYDYVKLGVLNAIDGIYEPELGIKGFGETDKKVFVIISHMHIDHMGGLGCLDQKLPVYMSSESARLYHELGVMGELEVREHETIIPVDYDGSFTVSDIKVTCVQVDHDVIGACGFLIETPDGKICYTGDYRYHGYHPEISAAFAQKCKGADVMISEGVTISHGDVDVLSLEGPYRENTELTLLDKMKEFTSSDSEYADGLIIINNYNRNVERIHNFTKVIKEAGRVLALSPEQTDYVAAFYKDDEFSVYLPEGGELTVPLLKDRKVVTRKDILANPSGYVLQQDYSDSYELFELADVISVYLHMDGAPLGDYDPSYAKFYELLKVAGITAVRCGLGGHAEPYYLRKQVDDIAPRTLIPLHSFRPEQLLSKKAGKIILPNTGDTIELIDGQCYNSNSCWCWCNTNDK